MSNKEKNCYSCVFRGNVPGSAHSRCKRNFKIDNTPQPQGNTHGIKNGWFMFPINYDPIWIIDDCKGFSETMDNTKIKSGDDDFIDFVENLYKQMYGG